MAKKTQKFETPIDQRETFVSIQKNFGDSDLTVEEKLKTLYDLQQVDTEIDHILCLRGELPVEVEALEAEIAAMNAKIDRSSEQITLCKQKITACKNEIVERNEAIEKYKSQIENVSNSREFDSLSKEIENTDLLRQIAEKKIGEAKVAIEEKTAEIETIKEKLAVREEDLKAKQKELATIVESTAKQEKELRARREANAVKVDARTMSAYDRIRRSNKNHLAVVSVFNGNACGGCFSTISPQRLIDIASNKKMIICEYCGRILVNPDFE